MKIYQRCSLPQAKDVFKYKLKGDTRAYKAKANVRARNLEAFNGIIHIVNRVLTITPEVKGDPELSLLRADNNSITLANLSLSLLPGFLFISFIGLPILLATRMRRLFLLISLFRRTPPAG